MAGDWMKIELELPDKPEVHAIAQALNLDPDCIVGKLIRIWQWFDKHTTDGNARGVTFSLPDRIVGVSGFGSAMSDVGWLELSDGNLVMPKFDRHTSESAKARALTAKRAAKHRGKSNASSVTNGVTDALPREEKRREEVNNTDATASVAGKPATDVKPPCPADDIIGLYHELMPLNPRCKVINEARRRTIRARWKEAALLSCEPFGYSSRDAGLAAWRRFFEICAESEFLTGRAASQPGRPPFVADIDFLMSPSGFAKCLENKYHREAA